MVATSRPGAVAGAVGESGSLGPARAGVRVEPGSSLYHGLKRKNARQRRLISAFIRHQKQLARPFEQRLLREFNRLGERASVAYLSGAKGVADDERIAGRITREARAHLFNQRVLKPAFQSHYEKVAEDTLTLVNEAMGFGVELADLPMRQILATGGTRAGLVDVAQGTRNAIFRAITAGRARGDGPAAVARSIRELVPAGRYVNAGAQYRARLIAVTETKYAQNVSAMQTYRASGTVTALLAFDAQGAGETDDECIERDGNTYSFDDADVELASEHPGGTLSFAPVVEGVS
jgi:hypothetical protein